MSDMAAQRSKAVKNKRGHEGESIPDSVKTAFVMWLVDPNRQGTQGQWAAEHGLAQETVSRWKGEDPFVLGLMAQGEKLLAPFWTEAFANLVRIAVQRTDDYSAINAIREMGKILGKYPKEKVELSLVDRVAYVEPDALQKMGEAALARPN